MSYGLRFESGRMSSSASSPRSAGSAAGRTGGRSSQCDGKYDRYCLIAAMHSSSSATSMSPTPDLRQCTRDPPSSSCVTSSPIAARTRCGPASAIEPRPLTIGTKSASPGMYAVPAAHGPIRAATCGITPLITTSSRNRWPEPANSEPTASWIRAPAESSSQTNGIRWVRASSRRRVTLGSPVMPIDPAMTVKS